MEDKSLGALVKQAKGDDRSLREFAKDSGVDAAVISKMINGTYAPKKPEIYLKLTSPQAAPRGDVTFEQLIGAADTSRSFQAGMTAGLVATSTILAAVGGTPITALAAGLTGVVAARTASKELKKAGIKKEKDVLGYSNERILEFEKKQKQFRSVALGVIITSLAKRGVTCKVEDISGLELGTVPPDECLTITNQSISSWWLSFWAKDEKLDERAFVSTTDRALIMLSRYTPSPADPMRKISIVVDDTNLYDELTKYKARNSFRGEMSIILVDQSSYEVAKEVYVAHYDEADTTHELFVVSEKGEC